MLPNSICQALQHVLNAQANVQLAQVQPLIVILAYRDTISPQRILAVPAIYPVRRALVLI